MKNNKMVYPVDETMEDVFKSEVKKSKEGKLPEWIEKFLPQFTTEIPRDPVDKDEDNFQPIKNDKKLPILP